MSELRGGRECGALRHEAPRRPNEALVVRTWTGCAWMSGPLSMREMTVGSRADPCNFPCNFEDVRIIHKSLSARTIEI